MESPHRVRRMCRGYTQLDSQLVVQIPAERPWRPARTHPMDMSHTGLDDPTRPRARTTEQTLAARVSAVELYRSRYVSVLLHQKWHKQFPLRVQDRQTIAL